MASPFLSHAKFASTGDGSSINSSLLTSPLTPCSDHDIPYKPTNSDEWSLNMKKNHHRSRKHKNKSKQSQRNRREPHESAKKDGLLHHSDILRSKSLELLRTNSLCGVSPGSIYMFDDELEDAAQRVRRWTLPSKSAATRCFTPMRSTVKQATLADKTESPAMITLRRATMTRQPKKLALTFFPEPKFGNERTSLLSYLVSTFRRADTNKAPDFGPLFAERRNSRSSSIDSNGAHPTVTYPAATVCTETTVEPSLAMPGQASDAGIVPTPRRCSTKYVTGGSTYEIIWDENDSLSSTQESSRPSVSDRRQSLAISKLEAQLAQSQASTRRSSAKSRKSSSQQSVLSTNTADDRALSPDKLGQIFPRLLHQTGLRDLPRSRGNGMRKNTISSVTVDDPEYEILSNDNRKVSTCGIDFFPPLSSRRMSVLMPRVNDVDTKLERTTSMTSASPRQRQVQVGSMIGSSSHTRRRSSAFLESAWHRESLSRGLVDRLNEDVPEESVNEERETDALLGTNAKRRASRW